MTEAAPENPAPATEAPTAQQPPAEKPPWGDDFDADKAWKLIQNLRSDKEKLSAREVLTDEQKTRLAEYDKYVEASKTELQKAQEAASKVPTLEEQNLRLQVALEKGLTGDRADLAARLQGKTKEELSADADKLLALLAPGVPAEPQSPRPNPAQGASATGPAGTPQLSESDVKRLYAEKKYAEIEKARQEGRLDSLLGA